MSSCYLTLLFLGFPTVNEHFVLMKRIMTKLNQSKIKKAETFRKKKQNASKALFDFHAPEMNSWTLISFFFIFRNVLDHADIKFKGLIKKNIGIFLLQIMDDFFFFPNELLNI